MKQVTTTVLYKELVKCKKDKELELYIENYEKQQLNWGMFISEQMMLRGLSYEKMGDLCGFSKNTIKSWCEKGVVPRSREQYIKLGFGLGMNEEEMNHLLRNYGGYPELYAKDVYDAICIYFLKRRMQNMADERYRYPMLKLWYEEYEKFVLEHKVNEECHKEISTKNMHRELLAKEDEKAFHAFLEAQRDVFLASYSTLYSYMDNYIAIACKEMEEDLQKKMSPHQLFLEKHLDSGFEVAYSKLKNYGIVPSRKQLISFGVAMNMSLQEMNTMLEYAHMRPLYVRNRWECIYIYLLRQFEEEHPMAILENAFRMEQMVKSPELRKLYQDIINHFYSMDESSIREDDMAVTLDSFIQEKMKTITND
ncbi:MAG: helix-turn-helix domain-containing protein [Lachnospiraceae bacterium]|nr:helix-turn-helix domain-containing protein [Lachnospiraceae bacterium]